MAKAQAKQNEIYSLMYVKHGQAELEGPYNSENEATDAALELFDNEEITKISMVSSDHEVIEIDDILTLIVVVGANYNGDLDFIAVKVRCTSADRSEGRHYDAALSYVKSKTDLNASGSFFIFDEHDPAFSHIDSSDLCDSLDVVSVKRIKVKTSTKKGK